MRLQPRALRPLLLGLAWCGLWAGSAALWRIAGPRLLLNLTPSVPRGLYLVTPCPTVTRGMLVVVPPPAAVAALLVARGYLGARTPLLKPVAAVAGDRVCVDEESVVIQGVWRAPVATRDRRGRPLPRWRGCVTLGVDEVFLLSTWQAHSFDSRYFGPVGMRQLLGVAAPVVLWDGAAEHHWDAKGQDTDGPSRWPQRALRAGNAATYGGHCDGSDGHDDGPRDGQHDAHIPWDGDVPRPSAWP
jgi:conjugative transfer signal peptidase TraF